VKANEKMPEMEPGEEAEITPQPAPARRKVKKVTLRQTISKIKWPFSKKKDKNKKEVQAGEHVNFFRRVTRNPKSCLLYGFLGTVFSLILLGIIIVSFLIFQYFTIAASLPSVDDLSQYASQFETTRIYDRSGNLIYEILDPNAGRRTHTPLEEISPYVIAATIATEDKDFYTNPGFDPPAIMRALWQNYTSGRVVSGASTITQQLARTLLLSPEERSQTTARRKAREIVLAAEITRKYSKDEIMELYLNEIYYSNLAYGIQAAAETYFDTDARNLDLAQASFLAGLPQAPAVYDVFINREAALLRHKDVLNLMYQLSRERNCIRVSQLEVPVCVRLEEAVAAVQEIEEFPFVQKAVQMLFPHWVNYIRSQLEQQFDAQTIYRSGFSVYTTLDPVMQNYAQDAVAEQVASLTENNATGGALVALNPSTGEILAMVGSPDFYNENASGQVNMAVAPRQPGSSIKPLTYTAAFEKGWTPATLIWDVPSEFPPSGDPNDTREPYEPVNYDRRFHGPVLVRTALGSSYNVPAVKALDFIGIYDNPNTPQKDGFIALAERMGITTLTREDYGLSLTLGGGDVSLLELTGAFAIYANNGVRKPAYAIQRITDHFGEIVFEHQDEEGQRVIDRDHAYLISDILADNSARTPGFGANSVLNLPFRVAVKTGTTNDFRDNWTLGYTPDIAIGVWIGNPDYTPMINISGVTGAAPLWSNVIQWAIGHYTEGNPSNFRRPDNIEEHVICKLSGTEPSDQCPNETTEIFARNQPPLEEDEDLWQEIAIDTWTNLKAGPACAEYTEEMMTLNVQDKWARKWVQERDEGRAWAENNGFDEPIVFTPERECRGDDPHPSIVFVGLNDDMNVTDSPLDIYAVISATANFDRYELQFGVGNNPTKWKTLAKGNSQVKQPEKLVSWDISEVNSARVTLRIYVHSTKDTFAEKRIHLNLILPEATPTIVPTETIAPTATEVIPPSPTPEPTSTPVPTETPTPTPP
jgi:penicillin-binding protein 1C